MKRISCRPSFFLAWGAFWGAGAIFMVVLGVVGSGDTWIAFVVAAANLAFAYGFYGAQTVAIRPTGVKRHFPWSPLTVWTDLGTIEFSPGTGLNGDELHAVRADGTTRILAIFPTYFVDSTVRVEKLKLQALNTVSKEAKRRGWSPSCL